MTTIGNIGIGLFILIIVWISTLIIFFIAVKTQSNLGWVAIGIALLITLILVLIPVEKINKAEAEEADTSEKDYGYVGRIALLTFLFLSTLVGAICFFLLHCIEPVRTKPVKAF